MEQLCIISEFPGYCISNTGIVRNVCSGYKLTTHSNQHGVSYVSFRIKGKQYVRSVARLTAVSFLEPPKHPAFDTPINRDGNRENNDVSNLLWRPHWFAVKFHRQFNREWSPTPVIEELTTGDQFDGALPPAAEYGLLAIDILTSALNYTWAKINEEVWPTGQQFRVLS